MRNPTQSNLFEQATSAAASRVAAVQAPRSENAVLADYLPTIIPGRALFTDRITNEILDGDQVRCLRGLARHKACQPSLSAPAAAMSSIICPDLFVMPTFTERAMTETHGFFGYARLSPRHSPDRGTRRQHLNSKQYWTV